MNENQYYFEKAIEYEKNNQTLYAIQIYISLINDIGFKRNSLFRLISIYERYNKINTAIELFQRFLKVHRNDDDVLVFFGNFLIRHSLYLDSIEYLNQVNTVRFPEVYFLLGAAHYNTEELNLAISNFSLLLKKAHSADLHYKANIYLAKSHYSLNDYEKALGFVHDSRKLNSEKL
jgi:tetratricopeptide (TPR) repeat protein